MKTKVTIYRITVTDATQITDVGVQFSLEPWGQQTREYKGHDDGGQEFLLPRDFSIGRDAAGSLRLYDPRNLESTIVRGIDQTGVLFPAVFNEYGIQERLSRI